jgi:hypothetical protein
MAFLAKTSASRDVMAREKRPLDQRDGMPEEKRQRPALASVIVEAVKMDSLQKLCSTLELDMCSASVVEIVTELHITEKKSWQYT